MNSHASGSSHPAIWMIGDVQGCHSALQRLLAHPEIAADPHARFWFAGDLVNRGPESLATLRTIMSLGARAVAVLGNHDLHMLAVAAGVRAPGQRDTLAEILNAPDAEQLITWLRQRPLAHFEAGHLLVHAGVLAPWTVAQTLALAGEVQTMLRGADWREHLGAMYGDKPNRWKDSLSGAKRLRVIINALTRMRLCTPEGHMVLSAKGAPTGAAAATGLVPWYDLAHRAIRNAPHSTAHPTAQHTTHDVTVVFGHWSTLGLMLRPDVICLDSGCVWGGQLSAVRLHDRHVVQVACEAACAVTSLESP